MENINDDHIDNIEMWIVLSNYPFFGEIYFRELLIIELNGKSYLEYVGVNKDECKDDNGSNDMNKLSEKLKSMLPKNFPLDTFIKERYVSSNNADWFLIETDLYSLIGKSDRFMCEFGECVRKVIRI